MLIRPKQLVINRNGKQPISVNCKKIKVVKQFKYLGSMIKDDGDSSHEIKTRIAIARNSVIQLTAVWKSADISRELKVVLVKSLIWSTLLYGAESWTLKKSDETVLQSLEIWVWRRVFRISWTERKTNKWVRERIGVKEEDGIVKQIKRRELAKYMHWKWRPESTVMISGMVAQHWLGGGTTSFGAP